MREKEMVSNVEVLLDSVSEMEKHEMPDESFFVKIHHGQNEPHDNTVSSIVIEKNCSPFSKSEER